MEITVSHFLASIFLEASPYLLLVLFFGLFFMTCGLILVLALSFFNKEASLGRLRKLLKLSCQINLTMCGVSAPDPDDDRPKSRAKKLYRRFVVWSIFYRNPWLCPEMPVSTPLENMVAMISQILQTFLCHSTVVWGSMVVISFCFGGAPFPLSSVFWSTGFFWCTLTLVELLLGTPKDKDDGE